MNYLPLYLFVVLSATNIKTRGIEMNNIANATKLTLAPLALFYVLVNTSFDEKTQMLLIASYSFYLIGDAFLLSHQPKLFGIGLVSFLCGHICFIVIFFLYCVSFFYVPFILIAVIYPFYKMFMVTRKAGKLRIPMLIYSTMLVLFIAASSLLNNPFLIVGTSIFTLSDSFIAKNLCTKQNYGEFQIMGTYTLALILLSSGMIFQYLS
jgi:uncharacterized membrane protein YhhN